MRGLLLLIFTKDGSEHERERFLVLGANMIGTVTAIYAIWRVALAPATRQRKTIYIGDYTPYRFSYGNGEMRLHQLCCILA